jgi:DNA invertase Pin-like site-specific DNA recombinase
MIALYRGASLIRPGIQALLADAPRGMFDIVLAEALDRISRDQEDVAGFYKRLTFAGIKIVILSEGEITHLHVGLKGTMNALFIKDLADKTRRGIPVEVRDATILKTRDENSKTLKPQKRRRKRISKIQ